MSVDRTIVADSSSIISLALNCMSSVLEELGVKILVPDEIYNEIILRPMGSKRYALESMRIKKLFSSGVISVSNPEPLITREILNTANSVYRAKKHPLRLIHEGEAAALALLAGVDASALLIDERTTRMLIEDADGLRGVLCGQLGRRVDMDVRMLDAFRGIVSDVRIIRSSEIAAVAYEKGILGRSLGGCGKEALMAMLYALKFSGCAISWQEIEEYASLEK
jgi:predicted nucleic acid-binding protein